MIRRHPHVFGKSMLSAQGEPVTDWDAIKKQEKPRVDGSVSSGSAGRGGETARAGKRTERHQKITFEML